MLRKQKNTISLLLSLLFVTPYLAQLEHVFFNNHGIVYKAERKNISTASNLSCAVFHKKIYFSFNVQLLNFTFVDFVANFSNQFHYTNRFKDIINTDFLLRGPPSKA